MRYLFHVDIWNLKKTNIMYKKSKNSHKCLNSELKSVWSESPFRKSRAFARCLSATDKHLLDLLQDITHLTKVQADVAFFGVQD